MKSLYNILTTKGQLIALLLGVAVILLSLVTIFGGLGSAGYEVGTDLNAILKDGGGNGFNFFNTAISLPVFLIIVAFIAWIGFTLFQLISDPKGSLRMIIAFVAIIVFFFLFMSISDSETTGKIAALLQKNDISEGTSKMISGGIKTTVLLAVGAFIAMIVMEILNFFK